MTAVLAGVGEIQVLVPIYTDNPSSLRDPHLGYFNIYLAILSFMVSTKI